MHKQGLKDKIKKKLNEATRVCNDVYPRFWVIYSNRKHREISSFLEFKSGYLDHMELGALHFEELETWGSYKAYIKGKNDTFVKVLSNDIFDNYVVANVFLTKVDAEKHLEDFSYAYSHDAYVSEKMLERNYALLDFFKDLKQYFEIDNDQKQTNS